MVELMVEKWLALRDDPVKNAHHRAEINRFLRRADFATEDAYYVRLHERYMEDWQSGNVAAC